MTQEKLDEIIESHGRWLADYENGKRADLSYANLRGADLSYADLRGAFLPKAIVQIGPIGSRRSYTVYNAADNIVQCGCWNNWKGGGLDEFEKRIETVYPPDKKATLKYRKEYMAAIAFFRAMREMETQLETQKEKPEAAATTSGEE